ncbi:MAG: hypothetical protein EOO88_53635, partial [Pedobacter sp.]
MKPQHQQYTCPMHPDVVQDKPGSCPKCGMNLIPLTVVDSKEHETTVGLKPAAHGAHGKTTQSKTDTNKK